MKYPCRRISLAAAILLPPLAAAIALLCFAARAYAEDLHEPLPEDSPADLWHIETGAADYLIPIEFSSLLAAQTMAEIRGLADNYVEEREGGKVLARVQVGGEDEWLAIVTPEIPRADTPPRAAGPAAGSPPDPAGEYQAHRDGVESIVMRIGFRYGAQEEMLEAIYGEGFRPWKMTVREGRKLRIFPIGSDFPDLYEAEQEMQARLRYEHDGESVAGQEIVALLVDETTFLAMLNRDKPESAPCFVVRAGTAPYLEVEYLRDGSKFFQSFVSTAIAFATSAKNPSRPASAR